MAEGNKPSVANTLSNMLETCGLSVIQTPPYPSLPPPTLHPLTQLRQNSLADWP